MTVTDRDALSPENRMMLDELDKTEAVIPGYAEKMTRPDLAAPSAPVTRKFPCKFSAECGDFPNPSTLGKHYKEAHPGEHVSSNANTQKITCVCGRTVLRASWRYHMTHTHAEVPRGDWKTYEAKVTEATITPEGRIQCPQCPTTLNSRDSLSKHLRRKHGTNIKEVGLVPLPPPLPPQPEPVADEPLTVDGIVGTLVELHWPKSMPTRKALEMLEVRSVLERFLHG